MSRQIDDQTIVLRVIEPEGGLNKFRLVVCHEFKLIQVLQSDGTMYADLILEDDVLNAATIEYLERIGVRKVDVADRRKKIE